MQIDPPERNRAREMIDRLSRGNGSFGDGSRPRRPIARILLLSILVFAVLCGGAAVSYYVDALWFESLGYGSVFWTRIAVQAATFVAFALVTFLALYATML